MIITFICHSSFCVEFKDEKTVMIFDYYKGNLPEFPEDYRVFVFVSHKHFDHYSRKVLNLAYQYEKLKIIMPKEMRMTEKYMDRWEIPESSRDKIIYTHQNAEYDFDDVNVMTLKSTDTGNAYIVKFAGKTIYHAGDLNWWHWNGNTEEENADMARRYKHEIDSIEGLKVDLAFIPLDPRQEDKFYLGFDYFMRKCEVSNAFPMHMWGRNEFIGDFKAMDISHDYRDRIIDITKDGEIFEI